MLILRVCATVQRSVDQGLASVHAEVYVYSSSYEVDKCAIKYHALSNIVMHRFHSRQIGMQIFVGSMHKQACVVVG